MAPPSARDHGRARTPAPARALGIDAVLVSPTIESPPAPAARKERPAIAPQEMRRLARALDELCTKEDGELDSFVRRRAAGGALTLEDVRHMRDVLRWFAELLPSADEEERARLAEVWRIVGPVVGARR